MVSHAKYQHANGQQLTGPQWRALRQRWTARLPVNCPRCNQPIHPHQRWDLDHTGTPHALNGHRDPDTDTVHPAHMTCNRNAGAQLGTALAQLGAQTAIATRTNGTAPTPTPNFWSAANSPVGIPGQSLSLAGNSLSESDPEGGVVSQATPGPGDGSWAVGWLEGFRDVPGDASWPRVMSPPHPEATGSYGPDLIGHALERGVVLRWWQRLLFTRVLEHDGTGRLVWLDVLATTARQVGKSVALRELALWRMTTDLFGDALGNGQTVIHTGKDLYVCREVQRAARSWARDHAEEGWSAKDANGKEEVAAPNGSRWLIRGRSSVYGYTGTLAVVDEAWGVESAIVEDGIEPTLVEQESGQLVLFSTAHRRATGLVPSRRAGMLAALEGEALEPTSLIVEWSAEPGSEVGDREAWRQASPHWTRNRERMLEAKLRRVMSGQSADPDEDDPVESFKSQYLNIWPSRRWMSQAAGLVEPLATVEAWRNLADLHAAAPPDAPLVVAVDDWMGLRAAAAACVQLADGRYLVWGGEFDNPGDAFAWCSFTVGRRTGCRALLGRSLVQADAEEWLPEVAVSRVGAGATGAGLPLLRSLVRSGRLAHSGDTDLEGQVATVGLSPTINGGLTQAHRGVRADLLHAVAWAVAATANEDEPLAFYVY